MNSIFQPYQDSINICSERTRLINKSLDEWKNQHKVFANIIPVTYFASKLLKVLWILKIFIVISIEYSFFFHLLWRGANNIFTGDFQDFFEPISMILLWSFGLISRTFSSWLQKMMVAIEVPHATLCKSEINVLRKLALNVFRLVIHIRIGKWPNDEIIMIDYNLIQVYNMDLYSCNILQSILTKHVKST